MNFLVKMNTKYYYSRGRESMAREPYMALFMTASGSLDILLTRLLRMKLFQLF